VGTSPGAVSVITPAISARDSLLTINTIRGYVRDWKDFFKVDDLKQISVAMCVNTQPEDVAAFRDECLAKEVKPGKTMSPGTVARKLTALRVLFDYLINRKLMIMNPANPKLVRGPKRASVLKMERLSHEEALAFFRVIDRTNPLGRRDYALIMMDLHMGLRRSEALAIKSDQFQVEGGVAYITFRSKGEKDRKVTVNENLAAALTEYAQDRGNSPGWLFPGRDPERPLSGDQFWRIVTKYLEIAHIDKKIGTHGLRATFITHNIEAGTPLSEIQKTVGHSRPETTLGYARDLEMIKSRAPKAMEGFGQEKK
jgi:site-specific recombinase XerD